MLEAALVLALVLMVFGFASAEENIPRCPRRARRAAASRVTFACENAARRYHGAPASAPLIRLRT